MSCRGQCDKHELHAMNESGSIRRASGAYRKRHAAVKFRIYSNTRLGGRELEAKMSLLIRGRDTEIYTPVGKSHQL
jgi:hypothetical protein